MSQTTTSTELGTSQTADRDKVIESAIQEVAHIATLPEITLRIIELVEDPDATAHDLHEVIANDPALCARVLKVVNSAFYGLPGQIGSINRAIVLLGLNAVKNIAIAASLAKLFRGGRLTPTFSARDLWTHSITVAAATRVLASKVKLNLPDEAFLGGLIHDIGVMVEMQTMRPKLLEVLDLVSGGEATFIEAEQKVIGATHEDFGRALCEKWKFPNSFAFVTGFHHCPMGLEANNRTMTALVHVADILAARSGMGYSGTVGEADFQPGVCEELKLTAGLVDEINSELPDAVRTAEALLN